MIQNDERLQSICSNIIEKVKVIKDNLNENGQTHHDYMLEKLNSALWDLNLLVNLAKEKKEESKDE